MNVVRSNPLELPAHMDPDEDLSRADLVFYGVDHSGQSYEALVYVDASDETFGERDPTRGYAGSFTVFGHAGCYGEEGHCLPADRFEDEFDRRAAHPMTPYTKTVTVTDTIRDALRAGKSTVTVTVLAIVPDSALGAADPEPLKFRSVRLVTFEG